MKAISVRRSLASELSDLAYMSSPEKSTWPALGLSRPPRRWSRVDFPTPEAPMRATLSAWLTTRLTPRRTRTVSGPTRYSFSSSLTARRGSLIAQDLDGVESRRPSRGRQGGEKGDQERRRRHQREVEPRELHGQMVDLIDVAGQPDDLVGVLHPDQEESEQAAAQGAHDADEHARDEKDRPYAARRGAHGLENADLLALLGHEEHEVPDDGEARHEDDDGDDHEERELLELERREQVAVHPHPVADPEPGPRRLRHAHADGLGIEGVAQLDLDAGHAIAEPRELLGRGQPRVGHRRVVLVEPDLDVAGDLEAPHFGYEAHGGHRPLRGDDGDVIPGHEPERARQLAAEEEGGLARGPEEGLEAARSDVGLDLLAHGGRGEVHPAEKTARRATALPGEEGLLEHEGRGRAHAGNGLDARGHARAVLDAAAARVDHQDVRVGRDDLLLDPVLESRHHGQDHDQRADAEEDAAHADPHEQREIGPLAPRPQVAQREEQLDGQAAPGHQASASSSAAAASPGARRSRRRWGNRITSRIDGESVKSMASRSMPIPSPAVGGMPYSRARTKSSSIQCASSSPRSRSRACSSKRRRWSIGSLSSE